jgi:hypothetical protein
MDDGEYTDGQGQRGREALLVLLVILLGGLVLIAAADRLVNVGPIPGNILFAALPPLAAVAAAAWLHHGERG